MPDNVPDGGVDLEENPYVAPVTSKPSAVGDQSEGSEAIRNAPWAWVPSLYFAEGVPYVIVMTLAGDMYFLLGIENDRMARYTSLLYLPWVIKPLWSPLVDVLGTQRRWILVMQSLIAAGLAGVALMIPTEGFFVATLAFFWLLAISSATHDIAADGFYMSGLSEKEQAWFVGIRSTFYRAAMFFVSAVLLALAGRLDDHMPRPEAWAWTFAIAAALFAAMAAFHAFALPRPPQNHQTAAPGLGEGMIQSITSFFQKPGVGVAVAFLLLFRFSEAQLAKLARPFMFAPLEEGGLALNEESVAVIYGTFGIAALTIGGILGGMVLAKSSLRRWLLPMALALNLPNVLYAVLAITQPTSALAVGIAVSVEQFGYGFGFAAYLMYMIELSRGEHQTAHYALCTGFMALGMMLPGIVSGDVQVAMGYKGFFIWVAVATLPSLLITWWVQRAMQRLPLDSATA